VADPAASVVADQPAPSAVPQNLGTGAPAGEVAPGPVTLPVSSPAVDAGVHTTADTTGI
jgi:hypothetical protein